MRALEVVKGSPAELVELDESRLPDGDDHVLIDVTHSSLNYKDALALAGRPGVIRADRLIAGIDLVGTRRDTGERVLVNGRGLGETHDGGLAEVARVPEEWLVPVPERMSDAQAAAIGTAGYTAALCVLALDGIGDGPVAVTGATGGVGSIAIMLLARAGREVHAVTGKASARSALEALGATGLVDRADLAEPGKPLQPERWAGVVDAVSGPVLANLLSQTRYGGVVAACGMAADTGLATSIMPFILRAVSLVGVNSVFTPFAVRDAAWQLLDRELDLDLLDGITSSIGLGDAVGEAQRMLAGETTGRIVVEVRR